MDPIKFQRKLLGWMMFMLLSYFNTSVRFASFLFMQHQIRQGRLIARIFANSSVSRQTKKMALLTENGRPKERRKRRFWTRPGRTSAWWMNFMNNIVVAEEWLENFRMSRKSFFCLCDDLRPFLT